MTRSAIVVLASALLGCAQATPSPPGPPSVDGQATGTVVLSGYLSRKGPAETSYWAVTDATGKVFQIVDVTPDLDAQFRRLQNSQLTVRVERKGRAVLDQVRVLDVFPPAP